ncbi:MAG TPA: hypothetical protein VI336_02195 [Candidatus Saccharimonadales bacterium]|nr:hypothetical protein [Candidatus Saccharimonadales bacterium]
MPESFGDWFVLVNLAVLVLIMPATAITATVARRRIWKRLEHEFAQDD